MENVIGAFPDCLYYAIDYNFKQGEKTMKRSPKNSLIMSALSLLLCASMLIGTTFAWFTDSVTSTGNIIKSGTLDVTLEYIEDAAKDPQTAADTEWKNAAEGAIFNYSNWEPGFVQTRHIKIENEGTLALKYKVNVVPVGTTEQDGVRLSDVIDVYYLDPGQAISGRADLDTLTPAGTLTQMLDGLDTSGAGVLKAGEKEVLTIALKMQESAGNEYQNKWIGEEFAVQLLATQVEYENDSFDNTYDKNAVFPVVTGAYTDGTADKKLVVETEEGDNVSVTVPAGVDAGNYAVVVDNKVVGETADGFDSLSYDITLEKDGEKVQAQAGVKYPVEIKLDYLLNVKKLIHNGEEITNYDYDIINGIISFETDSFSPFSVIFEEIDIDGEIAGDKIVGGYFETGDFNPADYKGENLVADGYIAVEYTKNGKTCYAVSKKSETVIAVSTDEAVATLKAKHGDDVYAVNASGGNLWRVFTASGSYQYEILKGVSFNTVFIMPGTYNEATTIDIGFSVDIVGLGNAEDIKVIKVSGTTDKTSATNRHLFNCGGAVTLSEHIQVTIRNLYLDGTANNYYKNKLGMKLSADNASVQSIRLSKVKCYDLIVNDGNYPFYVNGKSDNRGAYMYVENCTLVNNFKSDSTAYAAPCALYYNNLTTYNGTQSVTVNDTYCKNVVMEADDWDWMN